jgi:hypothetical protein
LPTVRDGPAAASAIEQSAIAAAADRIAGGQVIAGERVRHDLENNTPRARPGQQDRFVRHGSSICQPADLARQPATSLISNCVLPGVSLDRAALAFDGAPVFLRAH